MAGYFFDSSALVKIYHPEVGTSVVDQIVNTNGNVIRISCLTIAELMSAFAIKVRTSRIEREHAEALLRRFRADMFEGKWKVFPIADAEFATAENLIKRHAFENRLRALDALQLASALELRKQHLVEHFVASDSILYQVAAREALSVIYPEEP